MQPRDINTGKADVAFVGDAISISAHEQGLRSSLRHISPSTYRRRTNLFVSLKLPA